MKYAALLISCLLFVGCASIHSRLGIKKSCPVAVIEVTPKQIKPNFLPKKLKQRFPSAIDTVFSH